MPDTPLPLIALVYHSGSGHTAEMAHAVACGTAAALGANVKEFALQDCEFKAGRWSDEAWLGEPDTAASNHTPWDEGGNKFEVSTN